MGRNDPCFCGSGKKQKKCHPDIHEASLAAEAIRLYALIDKEIEEHYAKNKITPPCQAGCYQCCYDAFLVSPIEIDIIIREMRKWGKEKVDNVVKKAKEYWEDFKIRYPDKSEYFEAIINSQDVNIVDTMHILDIEKLPYPCVFLDENKRCSIYNVRPAVCRLHGTAYVGDDDGDICEKIGKINSAKEWQADLCHIFDKVIGLSRFTDNNGRPILELRKILLLYGVYMHFVKYNSGLAIPNEIYKFQRPKEQYINFLLEQRRKGLL